MSVCVGRGCGGCVGDGGWGWVCGVGEWMCGDGVCGDGVCEWVCGGMVCVWGWGVGVGWGGWVGGYQGSAT